MAISSVGSTITGSGATSITGVIKSISFGGSSTTAIDVTSITSTFKTYVMGMADWGTITVSCFALSGSTDKPDMPTAGLTSTYDFVITMGAGAGRNIYTFNAYLVSTTMSAGVDEAVTVDYTLRISGAVAVTVGA